MKGVAGVSRFLRGVHVGNASRVFGTLAPVRGVGAGLCTGETGKSREGECLNIMAERMKCDKCGKDAIGFQGFGCSAAFVCADHADRILLDLKPGQRKICSQCVYERYG